MAVLKMVAILNTQKIYMYVPSEWSLCQFIFCYHPKKHLDLEIRLNHFPIWLPIFPT